MCAGGYDAGMVSSLINKLVGSVAFFVGAATILLAYATDHARQERRAYIFGAVLVLGGIWLCTRRPRN